ncbi:hypothetical protein K469DRAFT_683737 [Zopfia rhizophila CBS 207.26]|uniref:Uncharacterized protein n=1 Tax=Zopfia rhizophila CBS 207.26 TaxID=1314779 RepID=A0A6A6EFK3_9PEZI|nr:hypothetical protein K469DRAFT_683737 [Zopfia rhizophila CBS 207.26]
MYSEGLRVFVGASEDTVKIYAGDTLTYAGPAPNEIYAHLDEKYQKQGQLCDPSPVDLGSTDCKISFECTDNSESGDVMDLLNSQMFKFGDPRLNGTGDDTKQLPANHAVYCSALKGVFSVAEWVPALEHIGAVGGIATETMCGVLANPE